MATKKNDDAPAPDEAEKGKKTEKAPAKDSTAEKPSQLEPYPSGSPPDPEDEFERIHGFRRDGKK